jgi:hypothetical protein
LDAASVTIDPVGATLTEVASSHHLLGPFYSLTVDDGTALGDYSLTFEFTLPTKEIGLALLATLSEVEERTVCTGRGINRTCSDRYENVVIATLGGGSVTALAATPLPAALPLFAGGLGMLGLVAGRRKRKIAGLAVA